MSLLATASPWVSDTPTNKKRIPTIRKPLKNQDEKTGGAPPTPFVGGSSGTLMESSVESSIDGFTSYGSASSASSPPSIDDHVKNQETKNTKVTQLLENMSVTNDGDGLYNFNPAIYSSSGGSSAPPAVPTVPAVPIFQRSNAYQTNYANSTNLANSVNYSSAYEIPKETRPYYAQKLGLNNTDSFEEKILDKIQYLTHLMEEIQGEKTANVTEEFILYTMLGVFVIYVVDAFSRTGKYMR
jgi:acetylornithine/succinyldiaminopimelate/putrescine aminotransferase